ncbi:MAG TPA: hypothetical protein VFM79_02515, partial [Pelobium sp.]|nr:hypothetical protein [Pelobium sp.]
EVKFIDLTVTVKNSAGSSVSGANVEIFETLSFETVEEKTTGSNGKANFKLKGAELYSVIASKGALEGGLNISNLMFEGDSYTIDVTIK